MGFAGKSVCRLLSVLLNVRLMVILHILFVSRSTDKGCQVEPFKPSLWLLILITRDRGTLTDFLPSI